MLRRHPCSCVGRHTWYLKEFKERAEKSEARAQELENLVKDHELGWGGGKSTVRKRIKDAQALLQRTKTLIAGQLRDDVDAFLDKED